MFDLPAAGSGGVVDLTPERFASVIVSPTGPQAAAPTIVELILASLSELRQEVLADGWDVGTVDVVPEMHPVHHRERVAQIHHAGSDDGHAVLIAEHAL